MSVLPIASIDPSLKSSGICYGTNGDDLQTTCCGSDKRGETVLDRVRRYEGLVSRILAVVELSRPRLILLEGYSFASTGSAQTDLAEFGGILRWNLTDYTPHILEVAPTTLKKFAIGKGAGDKALVMAHVHKNWGKIFATSDEADAYVMAQMALCIVGRQKPANQAQREAVAKVLSGHFATAEQIMEFCAGDEKPF